MPPINRDDSPKGYLLCDDLIFTSRITGTARDLGLEMAVARSIPQLKQMVQDLTPVCILLDLHHPNLDIADLVAYLREACHPTPFILGYGSHVATEVLRNARAVGCDLVLPRSKFVEELPSQLPSWFSHQSPTG